LVFLPPLVLASAARGDGKERETELAKGLARVRVLQEEAEAILARVAPAVGAVTNYVTVFDPATGRVAMRPRSLGSGVVVTRDGYLLTNVHVVEGAGYLTVTLPDGGTYPAVRHADIGAGKVRGDIALLQIQGKERFDFVDWRAGDPQHLSPGSFVFALGNPHGLALDGTPVATLGILSGTGRVASDRGLLYVGVLQTDAEINPGNSGGPLFDAKGRLIGINGLMYSRAGRSNSGIGFAIPIDQIRLFMRKLLKRGGAVGYGFHGLEVETAPGEGGARITSVFPESPAADAGLRRGDVIVLINGKRIRSRADYLIHAAKLPEKSVVRMVYKRRKKRRTASYRLASYTDYLERVGKKPRRKGPFPPQERGYLGAQWKEVRTTVALTRVLAGTGAEAAGLDAGDELLQVDGETVQNATHLAGLLAAHLPGERVAVTYRRAGRVRKATVKLCDARQAAEVEAP